MWSRVSPTWTGSLFGSKPMPSYTQGTISEPLTLFGQQGSRALCNVFEHLFPFSCDGCLFHLTCRLLTFIPSQLSGEEVFVAGQRGPPGEPGRCLLQGRWHQECHPQVWTSPDAGPIPHQRWAWEELWFSDREACCLSPAVHCILACVLWALKVWTSCTWVKTTLSKTWGCSCSCVWLFALSGMDVYGYLMAREGHLEDVEVLGGRLFNISDQHAEPWVISGWVRAFFCGACTLAPVSFDMQYYCPGFLTLCVCCSVVTVFIASDTPEPCTWEPRPSSWTATVCRLFSWRGQHSETWVVFKKPSSISEKPCAWPPADSTAMKARLALFHFYSFKWFSAPPGRNNNKVTFTGLIDCYLASNGIREAMGMANNIYKTLGANAQTLTILATVCLEDPVTQEKAKTLLDKALAQRPDYTKAVVKKAELLSTYTAFLFTTCSWCTHMWYATRGASSFSNPSLLFSGTGREQKYEEGITLLRNALANQSDCVLHRMLGDFLVAVNDYQEAMDQYSIALR